MLLSKNSQTLSTGISLFTVPLWSQFISIRLTHDMYWFFVFACNNFIASSSNDVMSCILLYLHLELYEIRCRAYEMLLFSNCLAEAEMCLCDECPTLHYAASHIGIRKQQQQRPGNVILQATVSASLLLASHFRPTFLQLPASWFNPLQLQDGLLPHFRNDPINFNILAEARQLTKKNASIQSLPPLFNSHIVVFRLCLIVPSSL